MAKPAVGKPIPGSNVVCFSVTFPTDVADTIRQKAEEDGRSFSNMVMILTKKGLKVCNDNQH